MTANASAKIATWLAEPTSSDVDRALARLLRSRDVKQVAVMPDVHLAKDVCNGVAVATSETIYPAAVGGDIGCGMSALAFDAEARALQNDTAAAAVLSSLYRHVPSNRHGLAPRRRCNQSTSGRKNSCAIAPKAAGRRCSSRNVASPSTRSSMILNP